MVIDCEREIYAVYARKIWSIRAGSAEQVFAGRGAGSDGAVAFCALEGRVLGSLGFSCICVFPDVFQKLYKAVCGKSGICETYGKNQRMDRQTEKYDAPKKDASYL